MSKASKKNHARPQTIHSDQTQDLHKHWTSLLDDWRLQWGVAIIAMACMTVLYLSQNLFNANNLNDFSEYYLRAQDWARGSFHNSSGSDILLSAVEYVGIKLHPHDFIASYYATSKLLIVLTMAGSLMFILRNNDALPSFWVKLASIIVTLSIPHFLFATVTIDQTLLFAACLLFFLSTYNIPWAGFVAAMTFFSRPEAIIIFPLYGLLWYVDTPNRKRIIYSFAACLMLLIGFKFILAPTPPLSSGEMSTTYQEYSFLGSLGWDYFTGLVTHLANIPIIVFTYAYECLQSTALFILFTIGFVFSVRQRTSWVMYGVLIFFLTSYAVLYATADAQPYSFFTSTIKRMSMEKEYFIVNAFNKFDASLGHGRYRLVLYPAIAFFVIQGVSLLCGLLLKLNKTRSIQRLSPLVTLGIAGIIAISFVGFRNTAVAKSYDANTRLDSMHPVHKLALNMRKSGSVGTVLLDNFCDPSQGSFLMELAAYGGIDNVLTRFCDNSRIWVLDNNNRSQVLDAPAYKVQMPLNNGLHGMFYRSAAKQSELYDTAAILRWQAAASTYNDSLLRALNISHVIAARAISAPSLKLIDSLSGAYVHTVRN